MASEEARAKWLHYPNHFIIQEDQKGGLKPSSQPPSSSRSHSDENRVDGVKSYDFPLDSKWWLRQQPKDHSTSFLETSWETLEIEEYAKIKELAAVIEKKAIVEEVEFSQDDDHILIPENPEKLLEPQLIGINKTEPWWRTTDLNELASFVSEKSVEHIDNSDLPQPQMNNKPDQQRFVPDKGLASLNHASNFTDSMPRSPTSRLSACGLDYPLSTTSDDDENPLATSELSKAQLLEALCHSQTRAREAEKAAQQAYNEKEHMITHFLKQASQLFAYKQWLYILHLETTYLHLKNNKYELIYTRFPDFVPWVPTKGKQQKRDRRKSAKRYKIGKSFGSFLWGLTLVGAGLLLGWTLGWLFR